MMEYCTLLVFSTPKRKTVYGLWVMGGLVPFAASFLAEPMAQSSHPPLVAKTWAKIYSGTKNASGS